MKFSEGGDFEMIFEVISESRFWRFSRKTSN